MPTKTALLISFVFSSFFYKLMPSHFYFLQIRIQSLHLSILLDIQRVTMYAMLLISRVKWHKIFCRDELAN